MLQKRTKSTTGDIWVKGFNLRVEAMFYATELVRLKIFTITGFNLRVEAMFYATRIYSLQTAHIKRGFNLRVEAMFYATKKELKNGDINHQ